jgi:hypothetical protein
MKVVGFFFHPPPPPAVLFMGKTEVANLPSSASADIYLQVPGYKVALVFYNEQPVSGGISHCVLCTNRSQSGLVPSTLVLRI